MTEQMDKLDKQEQLSLLLDKLNAGQAPHCNDSETAKLLLVADMLKKEGGVIPPPQHILDQTVERAMAGIQAGKTGAKRLWWYSGAVSTAAAVILVIGLNLLPSWQQQQTPVVISPDSRQEQIAEPVATPTPIPASAPIQESTPASEPTPASIQAPIQAPIPASIQPSAQAAAPVAEPRQENTAATQSAPAQSAPVAPPPSAKIAEEKRVQSYAKSAALPDKPDLSPLVLPGQSPDQVLYDKEQGLLKQVFFKGTPRELIIIQHQHQAELRVVAEKSHLPDADKATRNESSRNVVQVIIVGQEVILEGYQSPEELRKLAETLTPK